MGKSRVQNCLRPLHPQVVGLPQDKVKLKILYPGPYPLKERHLLHHPSLLETSFRGTLSTKGTTMPNISLNPQEKLLSYTCSINDIIVDEQAVTSLVKGPEI